MIRRIFQRSKDILLITSGLGLVLVALLMPRAFGHKHTPFDDAGLSGPDVANADAPSCGSSGDGDGGDGGGSGGSAGTSGDCCGGDGG